MFGASVSELYLLIKALITRGMHDMWGEPERVHVQNMEQLHVVAGLRAAQRSAVTILIEVDINGVN